MTTEQLNRVDVPLPAGRVLRLALLHEHDGSPRELIIAAGFESDPPLKLLAEGVNLPPSALPELRDALAQLEATAQ